MASELKFGNKVIFLGGNPITLPNTASDPGSASNGDLYYNTTDDTVRIYQNGSWQTLPSNGNVTALDSTFVIQNSSDTTKQIAFDASTIAHGVTRTITMPNANVDLGNLTNSNIAPSAAIAYSKLNLVGNVTNADLAGGITYGKLILTGSIVNSDVSASAAIAYSKLALTGSIVNADINASAAIAYTKLAALSNNIVPITNGSGFLTSSSTTATQLSYLDATSSIQTQLNATEKTANKGAANGYAPLDGSSKVPYANLPSALMTFKGAWNASTNTPTLADGVGTTGDTYRASVAGTQDLGSGPQTWAIGDFAIYDGTIWQHSPAADGVTSVNGSAGAVTVNAINQLTGDVTAGPASQSQSKAATVAKIQGTTVSGTTGSGNVVFSASPTLTGTITAAAANFSGAISASNFSGSSSGTNTGDQTITLTGDVTGSGTGSFATAISSNVVTNAKLAQMATLTIKGNNTGGTANASDLTVAQVNAILPVFTATLNGLAPLSGGGSTNFLRADGTWAVPSTTGATTALDNLASVAINASLLPGTDNSINVGSAIKRWATVFGINFNSGAADMMLNANSGANKLNIEASMFRRSTDGSNYVEEQYIDSVTLTNNATTTIHTYLTANYRGAHIEYSITNPTTGAVRTGLLLLANGSASVSDADQFTETIAANIILSATNDGTNVTVSAQNTDVTNNANIRLDVKRFRV